MFDEESYARLMRITHNVEPAFEFGEPWVFIDDKSLWNNKMLVVRLALEVRKVATIYANYLMFLFEEKINVDKQRDLKEVKLPKEEREWRQAEQQNMFQICFPNNTKKYEFASNLLQHTTLWIN